MNHRTITQVSTQASAFALAALMTLGLLASIEQLASSPAPDALLARIDGPVATQQVIITAKRLHQS